MADLIKYRVGATIILLFLYVLIFIFLVGSIPFSLYYTLFEAKPK